MNMRALARARVITGAIITICECEYGQAARITELDLSSYANNRLFPSLGGDYPIVGTLSVDGEPFYTTSSDGGLNVIGGPGGGMYANVNVPASTTTITTNVADAVTVYVLLNSGWGVSGFQSGELTFTGANGANYTYDLVEGANVRDHYNGSFINTVSASNLIGTYSGSLGERLDAYEIQLPSSFNDTELTDIVFSDYALGNPEGSPFLAAATVAGGVPEPSTWTLMLAGFASLGFVGYRKAKKAGLRVKLPRRNQRPDNVTT